MAYVGPNKEHRCGGDNHKHLGQRRELECSDVAMWLKRAKSQLIVLCWLCWLTLPSLRKVVEWEVVERSRNEFRHQLADTLDTQFW